MSDWKSGLPPGKMTPENKQWFIDTYEVRYTIGGYVWHRKKVTEKTHPSVVTSSDKQVG